jgi:hypothetical protein
MIQHIKRHRFIKNEYSLKDELIELALLRRAERKAERRRRHGTNIRYLFNIRTISDGRVIIGR